MVSAPSSIVCCGPAGVAGPRESADVGRHRVYGGDDLIEDSEHSQDRQRLLKTGALACLEAGNRVGRDVRAAT
jgi:hypothetical protein